MKPKTNMFKLLHAEARVVIMSHCWGGSRIQDQALWEPLFWRHCKREGSVLEAHYHKQGQKWGFFTLFQFPYFCKVPIFYCDYTFRKDNLNYKPTYLTSERLWKAAKKKLPHFQHIRGSPYHPFIRSIFFFPLGYEFFSHLTYSSPSAL